MKLISNFTLNIFGINKKLDEYGIRGVALNWLKDQMRNGKNVCVDIGDISSKTGKISYGVPQGSILGPKIIIYIYISDIFNASQKIIHFFADDTSLFCTGENVTHLLDVVTTKVSKHKIIV